jgi:hypothetical protein
MTPDITKAPPHRECTYSRLEKLKRLITADIIMN